MLAGTIASVGLVAISDPAGAAVAYVADPASLVNPFVGTASAPGATPNPFVGAETAGNTFPGADVPFGMVQWSPDTPTRLDTGGYGYDDTSIIGYCLTHFSGTGGPIAGDVPILPVAGTVPADPAGATEPLDHHDESASPGYYSLVAGGVRTQLTTTTRSGMAVFTFPTEPRHGTLLFKVSDSASTVTASRFHVVSSTEVDGSVTTSAYNLHFDMVFNRPFSSSGSWSTGGQGGDVTFDTAKDPVVQAKVGISYVSTANAVLNRRVENPGWNFQYVRTAARRSWNSLLSRVQIAGGTRARQATFYTALYHSLLQPNVFNDVNGQYMGYDRRVQKVAPGRLEYTNFSEWDISRSEIQLLSLLVPNRVDDMVTSMLNDYTQTGHLPKWSEDDTETYAMVGDPVDDIIAGAYAFGARKFNTHQALDEMVKQADVPSNYRPGLVYYERDGYLPINGKYGCCDYNAAVSTQEQYNVDDNSIAELAGELGENGVARKFATRAQNWQNVFNPASGFMQPKLLNGAFQPGFGPEPKFGPDPFDGFTETDSYVSTTMIPFDVKGLVDAEGGDQAWIELLNGLTSSVVADNTDQVQMGNEPSFGVPWEYDYVGVPFKTQEVVREIQDQDYADSPTGLAGNDDLGETSSWYVWSALGAYPENPGSSEVVLGSPLFSDIVLHLGNGGTITEKAPAAADNAPYVRSLKVNGTSWTRTSLPSSVFTRGGTLDWTLSTSPSTTWGAAAKDAPPSSTEGLLPALGYVSHTNGESVVKPGSSVVISLGVQSMSQGSQRVTWRATSESGVAVEPASGVLTVRSESKSAVPIALHVPQSASAGTYTVTFALHATHGTVLPDVVTEVEVP
ncbi:MAG: GH92 family glycosyl hydrolase [Actinomycetota bacterium]|jgi:predicted alpha-1,2-mannosidase|nr:GH92 family glycosyl hydrolase [Actinomycetota bacterium]